MFHLQKHDLCNANYHTYSTQATNELQDLKNDDGTYKPNAFHRICNAFFNKVASARCPIAAGDYLLHYMHGGKKKPITMSPQTFYTHFQKAMHVVKPLDCLIEKELDDDESKIILF